MNGPYYDRHGVTVHAGDCLDVLRDIPDASVHAVICDPPYGLADIRPAQVVTALTAWAGGDREHVPNGRGFMGRDWDAFVPPPAVWDECLRVLTPGGHLAAFAGSRTYDLMGLSIRMAGFEIRDGLQWLYGSGMPKGMDVSKALDKAAGAEREVVGETVYAGGHVQRSNGTDLGQMNDDAWTPTDGRTVTAPATPEAVQWSGWNTSLKPAHEPIVLARKPLSGTVAATVLAHGTGALHVDACRVGDGSDRVSGGAGGMTDRDYAAIGAGWHAGRIERPSGGRWPANVLLDEGAAAELDEQSGTLVGDSGGASRFFAQFRYTPDDQGFFPVESDTWEPPGARSTKVASTFAGRNPASTSSSSPTDGSGDRSTETSPRDTRSTTGTTTPSTMTSATSCASPPSGTTTTTSGSESSTGGSTESKSAAARTAESGSPSPSTTSAEQGPGRATAGPVSVHIDADGSLRTETSSTLAGAHGAPLDSPADDSRFFPTFRWEAKAPTLERPQVDGVAHPTVKPLAVMRWLTRLLTPPGGLVLDPFAGSGTTLHAARAEGFRAIGIEREPTYLPLIKARLDARPRAASGTQTATDNEPMDLLDLLTEDGAA